MKKQEIKNKKTWLEQQPTELIKGLKSVQTITYPDGKEEHLKGTFFIL